MPNRSPSVASSHYVAAGTLLGLFSALAYTLTNVLLRYLAAENDVCWISCLKAAPTVVIAAILIAPTMARGRQSWPTPRMLLLLIGTGLVVQIGGNLAFQFALATIGLALTVPLCFATLIFSGAIMGRAWLGEALSMRAITAMSLFVAAIGLLAWHAEHARRALELSERPTERKAAHHDIQDHVQNVSNHNTSSTTLANVSSARGISLGLIAAAASGVAYALSAVVIRSAARTESIAVTLGTISLTGVVSLGVLSVWRNGLPALLATEPTALALMISAGVLNAAAFFALGKSLKLTTVAHANMLNASQVALAAIAGVLVFDEPADAALGVGIVLMLVGLLIYRVDAPPAAIARSPRAEP
jgi:drug/metabolite transporter (DMT)-like permease